MASSNCNSIRDSVVDLIAGQTSVSTRRSLCVVTLPIKTLDGRYVEVFVEPRLGDMVLVHDGGKTVGELHVQGIHWTEPRKALLSIVAERYGAQLDDRGVFQIACKAPGVAEAVLAVSQCASVSMLEAARHAPVVEEEPISSHVKRAMTQWRPRALEIRANVRVTGANGADHLFDSVAHNKDAKRRTVAIKTLPFGYGARVQADRYGLMVLDIKGTEFDKWRRLAVISQVDRWPMPSLELVRKFSANTLELRAGEEHFADAQLIERVEKLAAKRSVA